MNDDMELLQKYALKSDESAFETLVARHVDLVFSTARRVGNGDVPLAEDVTQKVFADLARKARILDRETFLPAWLYEAARFAAANGVRTEQRRRIREQEAMLMNDLSTQTECIWNQIAPILDDALQSLSNADRRVIIMRYFQREEYASIGKAFGVTDIAAQKRVSRAVECLREIFRKRGLQVGATGLIAALSVNAVQAAPAGLALSICTTLPAATSLAAGSVHTLVMSTLNKWVVAAAVVAALAPSVYYARKAKALNEQVTHAENQVAHFETQSRQLESQRDDALQQLSASHGQPVGVEKGFLAVAEVMALAETAVKKPFHQHLEAFKDIITRISPSDFARVSALLESSSSLELKRTFRELLLAHWAEKDPKGALIAAEATRDSVGREQATLAVAKSWSRVDFTAALTWSDSLPRNRQRNALVQGMILQLSQTDPQKAATLAMSMPGRWQMFTAEKVATEWVQRDPDSTLAWIKALPAGSARARVLDAVGERLAQANPQAASQWVNELPLNQRSRLLDHIASNWAQKDLPGAIAWVEGLAEEKDARIAYSGLTSEWAQTDPQGAAAYLQKHRPDLLGTVAEIWGRQDPNAALAWSQQAGLSGRGEIQREIISGWAADSPIEAAKYVSEMKPGAWQNAAAQTVVSRWIENDPIAAAGWAVQIPDGSDRELAFQNIVLEWGKSDPGAVGQWLNALKEGSGRDTALVTYAHNILGDAMPDVALQWAQLISQQGIRENIIQKIGSQWLQNDPERASSWMRQSDLTERQKARLLPP